jgi:hypothetical protein
VATSISRRCTAAAFRLGTEPSHQAASAPRGRVGRRDNGAPRPHLDLSPAAALRFIVQSFSRVAFAVSAALVCAGCETSADNPFATAFRMRSPAAGCDILLSSNAYAPDPTAPPELYCVASAGGPLERLTYCNTGGSRCAILEAAPASDSKRMAVRRVLADTNADRLLSEADDAALTFLDLDRGAVSDLVPPSGAVSGVDWSAADVVVYSSIGDGGRDDLFAIDFAAQTRDPINLTSTQNADERRPAFDRTASLLVYDRRDESQKAVVWLMSSTSLLPLTQGGPGGAQPDVASEAIGADIDAAASPDGLSVVFRRRVKCDPGQPDGWEVLTLALTSSAPPVTIVPGCAHRGAPDWGQQGIIFPETDPVSGVVSLVLVDANGANRRTLASVPASHQLAHPRWLSPAR